MRFINSKALTTLFILVLLIPLTAISQSTTVGAKSYGLKLGLSIANQDWNYTDTADFERKNRTGLDVGGFIEFFNLPYFSLMVELHYIQKGFKTKTVSVNVYDGPVEDSLGLEKSPRADYISMPLLAKVRYETDFLTPYLMLGPRFDYLIDYNDEGAFFSKFGTFGFGITAALGIDVMALEPINGFLEVRYSPDLVKAYSSSTLTVKNRTIEVLAGVRILASKKEKGQEKK
jgi:hypothetical protein